MCSWSGWHPGYWFHWCQENPTGSYCPSLKPHPKNFIHSHGLSRYQFLQPHLLALNMPKLLITVSFPRLTPTCHILSCCIPLSSCNVCGLFFFMENSTHFSPVLFKAFLVWPKTSTLSVEPSPPLLLCLGIICFLVSLPWPCPAPQASARHSFKAGFSSYLYLNSYVTVYYLTHSKC